MFSNMNCFQFSQYSFADASFMSFLDKCIEMHLPLPPKALKRYFVTMATIDLCPLMSDVGMLLYFSR